jgi:hypothetical protein
MARSTRIVPLRISIRIADEIDAQASVGGLTRNAYLTGLLSAIWPHLNTKKKVGTPSRREQPIVPTTDSAP